MATIGQPILTNDVFRICVGAHHQPDCSHQTYMRHGVDAFLADVRTREALVYAVGDDKAASVLACLAWVNRRIEDEVR